MFDRLLPSGRLSGHFDPVPRMFRNAGDTATRVQGVEERQSLRQRKPAIGGGLSLSLLLLKSSGGNRRLGKESQHLRTVLERRLIELVTSPARANAVSAAQNVDECALCLQVGELSGTQGRVRGFGLGNRPCCSNCVLDVSNPNAKVGLGAYVRGWIARRVVDRCRYDLDYAGGRNYAGKRVR